MGFALVSNEDVELVSGIYWSKGSTGYVKSPKGIYMHRLILGLADSTALADHINGDKLDNRRENLRVATRAQNARNARAVSGFKGVHRHSTNASWVAQITVNRKVHHLGSFKTPEAAARAYDQRAIELHGEFARLNFPLEARR